MQKIKNRLFWFLFKSLASQDFYKKLNEKTLLAMNYGNGDGVDSSGEKWVMYYIANHLKNDSNRYTIFDVGANVGKYSLCLYNILGEKATIHAFEPSKETFSVLKSNIGNKNNIYLNNIGLSNNSCTLPLFSDKPTSGLTSVYNRRLEHFNIQVQEIGKATFDTLDHYCEQANVKHIHFMKMDIEGHELSVLQGAKRMLEKNAIDYIQFEFGGCNIDSRTFFQDFWYLLHDRYRIYRILQKGLYEITNYNEQLEVFICANFIAELKTK